MRVSGCERETMIDLNEHDAEAMVYTYDRSLKRSLKDFCRKYPSAGRLLRETADGSVTCMIDRSCLSISLLPPCEYEKAGTNERVSHGFRIINGRKRAA